MFNVEEDLPPEVVPDVACCVHSISFHDFSLSGTLLRFVHQLLHCKVGMDYQLQTL